MAEGSAGDARQRACKRAFSGPSLQELSKGSSSGPSKGRRRRNVQGPTKSRAGRPMSANESSSSRNILSARSSKGPFDKLVCPQKVAPFGAVSGSRTRGP